MGRECDSRGTTQIRRLSGALIASGWHILDAGQRLAPPLTLGDALQTTRRNTPAGAIHLLSSRGNFDQLVPGGGSSLRPTPPWRFCLAYFPLSKLLNDQM